MSGALERALNALRNAVTRGKALRATRAPRRTMLQIAGLAGETFNGIELLLPYGMSAVPLAGDVVILQILGSRAHLVALPCDDPSLRIADLQPGEFGFRDARGQQVVFRLDRIEVTTPLKAVVTTTGDASVTAGGNISVTATGAVNVTSSSAVNVTAPAINLGSQGQSLVAFMLAAAWTWIISHTHGGVQPGAGNTAAPNSVPTSGMLSTTVKGG